MKRALISIAALALVAILGLAALDALLDHDYRVERSAQIDAPLDRVWPLVTDLPKTEAWSPFLAADPTFFNTYGEKTSGVGASYVWTGEPGWGRYEVVEIVENESQTAQLFNPDMGTTLETWTFAESDGKTTVTWVFEGTAEGVGSGFVATFMDRLLGPMFEDGLKELTAAAERPVMKEEKPMEFDQYTFVLLKKGPNWTDADTPENAALQKAHLAHLFGLIEEGKMKVAGPFGDQEDDSLRGLCIYGVDLDEARTLAEADPRVKAGHLTVEAMRMYTPAGAMAFPRANTPGETP